MDEQYDFRGQAVKSAAANERREPRGLALLIV